MAKKALSITIDEDLCNLVFPSNCENKSQRLEELIRAGLEATSEKKELTFLECIEGIKNLLDNLTLMARSETGVNKVVESIVLNKYNSFFDAYVLRVLRIYNVDYYLTKNLQGTKIFYIDNSGNAVELDRSAIENREVLEIIKEQLKESKTNKELSENVE